MPALFRARRWRFLSDLVNGLGSTSRMVSAMLNDDEVARLIAEEEDGADTDEPPSSLRGQTHEAVILQAIFDVIVGALGGEETWPRPVTAVDRARENIQQESIDRVVGVMTPWAVNRP